MKDFIKLVDKIWNREEVRINEVRRGKNFLLMLKLDLEKIQECAKNIGLHIDKNGLISGEDLIPLTVSLFTEKGEIPGEETFVGIPSYRVHYYGISPELEDFVSLVLWPSKKSTQTLEKILSEIADKKDRVLKFEGNYKLRLPNEIHPFRAEKISVEESRAYDWRYVPYFKEVGDTILAHVSPTNFRKVYLRTMGEEYEKKYINLKTCVGIIKDIKSGEFALKLPYLNRKRKYYYIAKYHYRIQDRIEKLGKDTKIAFMILEEINSSNSRIPEHIIFEVERINTADILGHLLSFFLYNYYLLKKRLFLMNYSDFKKVFEFLQEITFRFCIDTSDVSQQFFENPKLFFNAYLHPFFVIHNDRIYFKPFHCKIETWSSLEVLTYLDHKLLFGENASSFCLHKGCKVIERGSRGSLVECPVHKMRIREGAKICEGCKFYYKGSVGRSFQKQINFLKLLFSVKSIINTDRLTKIEEIIEKKIHLNI